MKRRAFLRRIVVLPFFPAWLSSQAMASDGTQGTIRPLKKSHHAWRELLSPEAFQVLFEEHTEEPGSSELNGEYREGTYICAACYLPLFESRHKYESGTGWPSFTQPVAGHVETKPDYSLIFMRTEYHCVRCGGHQGHVFKDGPSPRGERWCNNGLALQFVLQSEPLPGLRG